MDQPKGRGGWRTFLAGALAVIALLVLAGLAVMQMGAYDVAASRPHSALGNWFLHGTTENSVRRQAADIAAPAAFTPAQVTGGAVHYKAMCQQCHGGPGADRAEFAQGLNPLPPRLGPELDEWARGDVFWIVKHGIRMSAMPAFGETHSDADIWQIVAFVEALPKMTPGQYRAFPDGNADARSENGKGEAGHQHVHAH